MEKQCLDVLCSFIRAARDDAASFLTRELFFVQSECPLVYNVTPSGVVLLSSSSSSSSAASTTDDDLSHDILTESNERAKMIVSLLAFAADPSISASLFLHLLQLLQNEYNSSLLLHIEDVVDRQHARRKLTFIRIMECVSQMMDTLGVEMILEAGIEPICIFIKVMLEDPKQEETMLEITLIILKTLLDGRIKIAAEKDVLLFDMCPALERLSLLLTSPKIATLASELRHLITTRDKRWYSHVSEPMVDANEEDLASALNGLKDENIAVRTHSLITIRKLILSKDATIAKNIPNLLRLFQTQLKHDDSAIYLAGIAGLSALGDIYPDQVIPITVDRFSDQELSLPLRLNLAEALLRIAQRTGELLPKYANYLISAFLRGTADKEESIRSSSLSNLAGVCEILRFALHPWITEIMAVVSCVIATEKHVEVRRGAIFVAFLLLRGIGKDVLSLISVQELQRLANQLQIVKERDLDLITSQHASDTLQILNDSITALLLPGHSI
eukprot:TRINITY_DN4046_c0_g1_i1.p1 TRINITY_DN4046_c0_g1~~TRINITY_DN4046_c0_g1_i1.p1  ORF type:complete len:502 (+),score=107.76 TRINITY_DN4046_c0_g1_i1:141-1646(+)